MNVWYLGLGILALVLLVEDQPVYAGLTLAALALYHMRQIGRV